MQPTPPLDASRMSPLVISRDHHGHPFHLHDLVRPNDLVIAGTGAIVTAVGWLASTKDVLQASGIFLAGAGTFLAITFKMVHAYGVWRGWGWAVRLIDSARHDREDPPPYRWPKPGRPRRPH